MSIAVEPRTSSAARATRPVAPAGAAGDTIWRSLFYFNVYRLTGAVLLVVMATAWGDTLPFGSRDYRLFVLVTGPYCLLSLIYFALIRVRWRFDAQLNIQVTSDIVAISLMTFASNGITGGLGLMLLTTLAAAGLIARGRLTLFYAALASIAVLLEHTYDVLHFDAPVALYAQAGLLSASYFMVAWLAHALAKYAVESEELAAQREIDLENMAQVSEHVIQDMQDGVLVVDGHGVIRQFNTRAERILGPLWGRRSRSTRRRSRGVSKHGVRTKKAQTLRARYRSPVRWGRASCRSAGGAAPVPLSSSRISLESRPRRGS